MAKKARNNKPKTIGPVKVTNQQEFDAFMADLPDQAILMRTRESSARRGTKKPKILFYYSGTWYGTFWG